MTAIRYVPRTGLGLVLLVSMSAVPMLTARAGGSYSMTVATTPRTVPTRSPSTSTPAST
jgi:hypothetical protein